MMNARKIAFGLLIAFLALGPFFIYPIFLMLMLCFAMFACAFNLLIGYTKLLSFGHAAFFGTGGYVAAWSAQSLGLTSVAAIFFAGLAGALLGACFGWIAIRRKGVYFAMITLALGQFVYFFASQAPFTGGEDGIQGVPRGTLLGLVPLSNDMNMYWLVAGLFLLVFLAVYRIVHSPFGQVLKAIRENETRATSFGYKIERYQLIVFTLSSAMAGIAGGTKAIALGFATLTDVNFMMSGQVILMTLVGGMGTLFGPVAGAIVVSLTELYLASIGSWVMFALGAMFVACVLVFRRGIVGEIAHRFNARL
jgi:branched-chain amino acid transport system permease protein